MNERDDIERNEDRDANRDPITGEPGSHPIGTGLGTAGAGAAGAAIGGIVGGPIGAVVGAVIGGVAGAAGGHAAAEAIDPTAEDAYWRENHRSRDYGRDEDYDTYSPAYRAGYSGYDPAAGNESTFETAEPSLRKNYESDPDRTLDWDRARPAAHDAWTRVHDTRRDRDRDA